MCFVNTYRLNEWLQTKRGKDSRNRTYRRRQKKHNIHAQCTHTRRLFSSIKRILTHKKERNTKLYRPSSMITVITFVFRCDYNSKCSSSRLGDCDCDCIYMDFGIFMSFNTQIGCDCIHGMEISLNVSWFSVFKTTGSLYDSEFRWLVCVCVRVCAVIRLVSAAKFFSF